jgi:hypothetical protein
VPTEINGLPAHVLLIHVIIVLVPLGALFTVLSAVWPTAHRKLGFISPLTCLIALVFVPVTTHAGNWLRGRVDPNHQIELVTKHANLGHTFWIYALGLFIVSAAVWLVGRRAGGMSFRSAEGKSGYAPATGSGAGSGTATATATRTEPQTRTTALPAWTTVVVAVIAVAMSILAVWQLYRVGDSGSHAAWVGRF